MKMAVARYLLGFCALIALLSGRPLMGELPLPRDNQTPAAEAQAQPIRHLLPGALQNVAPDQIELIQDTYRWLNGASRNETGLALSHPASIAKLSFYFERANPLTKQQLGFMKTLVKALSNQCKAPKRPSDALVNSHLCIPQEALKIAEDWVLSGWIKTPQELEAAIWATELYYLYDRHRSIAFIYSLLEQGEVQRAAVAASEKGFTYREFAEKFRAMIDAGPDAPPKTPDEKMRASEREGQSAIPLDANWWPTKAQRDEFDKKYSPSFPNGPVPGQDDFMGRVAWIKRYLDFRSLLTNEEARTLSTDYASRKDLSGEALRALGETYLFISNPHPGLGMRIPAKKAIEILKEREAHFKEMAHVVELQNAWRLYKRWKVPGPYFNNAEVALKLATGAEGFASFSELAETLNDLYERIWLRSDKRIKELSQLIFPSEPEGRGKDNPTLSQEYFSLKYGHEKWLAQYNAWREVYNPIGSQFWKTPVHELSADELPNCTRQAVIQALKHRGTNQGEEVKIALRIACTPEVISQQRILIEKIETARFKEHWLKELAALYSAAAEAIQKESQVLAQLAPKMELFQECNESEVNLVQCLREVPNISALVANKNDSERILRALDNLKNTAATDPVSPLIDRPTLETLHAVLSRQVETIRSIRNFAEKLSDFNRTAFFSTATSKNIPDLKPAALDGDITLGVTYEVGPRIDLQHITGSGVIPTVEEMRKRNESYESFRDSYLREYQKVSADLDRRTSSTGQDVVNAHRAFQARISNFSNRPYVPRAESLKAEMAQFYRHLESLQTRTPDLPATLTNLFATEDYRILPAPAGQKLDGLNLRLRDVRPETEDQVSSIQAARDASMASAVSFLSGQNEKGEVYLNSAEVLTAMAERRKDMAELLLGLSAAGWAQDLHHAVSGKDFFGRELGDLERAFAIGGTLSLGVTSKAAKLSASGLKAFAKLFKTGSPGFVRASKITDYAANIQKFTPINHGPLHAVAERTGTVADTFRSSSYLEILTKEPVKLYRVYTADTSKLSSYWSRIKPTGPYQAVLDSALDPAWGNSAKKWVEITVPPGEKFYEGIVGEAALRRFNNATPVGQILGGGNQVFVNKRIPDTWVTDGGGF